CPSAAGGDGLRPRAVAAGDGQRRAAAGTAADQLRGTSADGRTGTAILPAARLAAHSRSIVRHSDCAGRHPRGPAALLLRRIMPSELRTPKTLADWVDLDYVKRPRPLRRLWRPALAVALLGAVLYIAWAVALGSPTAFQAGPVSTAHALFNN